MAQEFRMRLARVGVRFREGSERNTAVSPETVTHGCKTSPPFCVKPNEFKTK